MDKIFSPPPWSGLKQITQKYQILLKRYVNAELNASYFEQSLVSIVKGFPIKPVQHLSYPFRKS